MATATASATASANVLGVFAHVDTTLHAIRALRQQGFSELTVYTPVPVEEIEEEVEKGRPLSRVRLFTVRPQRSRRQRPGRRSAARFDSGVP